MQPGDALALALALAALAAFLLYPAGTPAARDERAAAEAIPDALAPAQRRRVREALRAFDATYMRSFRPAGCTREAVLRLHALRLEVLGNVHAARMRAAHDARAERRLAELARRLDASASARIDDVSDRSDTPLLLPHLLGDRFYRRYRLRAAGDVAVADLVAGPPVAAQKRHEPLLAAELRDVVGADA